METTLPRKKDQRLDLIQDQLIRLTQLDFSRMLPVSEKGDDLDAIIVGLNTLAEELQTKKIM
jgi:hypothetical protein